MKNVEEIKKDIAFCKVLMDRLVSDVIMIDEKKCGYVVDGHTRIQNDIIRLRRELNEVRKSFEWNWGMESEG